MGKRTSIEKRELVLNHFKNGHSRRKISEMVNLSDSTVQSIISRFVHENRVHNKGRSAPNKILNPTDERYILRRIKENPKLSAPKLAIEVKNELGKSCSAETIRRILRVHDFNETDFLKIGSEEMVQQTLDSESQETTAANCNAESKQETIDESPPTKVKDKDERGKLLAKLEEISQQKEQRYKSFLAFLKKKELKKIEREQRREEFNNRIIGLLEKLVNKSK